MIPPEESEKISLEVLGDVPLFLAPEDLNLRWEGEPVRVNVLYGQVKQSGHFVAMVELKTDEVSCWGTSVQARRWHEWLVMACQAAFADATIINWQYGDPKEEDDRRITNWFQHDWLRYTASLLPRNQEPEITTGQLKGDFGVESIPTSIPSVKLVLSGQEVNVIAPLALKLAGLIMEKAVFAEMVGAFHRAMRADMQAGDAQIEGFSSAVYAQLDRVKEETEAFEKWASEQVEKKAAGEAGGPSPKKKRPR